MSTRNSNHSDVDFSLRHDLSMIEQLGRVLDKYKVGKHFELTITDTPRALGVYVL